MFSAPNDANFDFLWLCVMTPWRVKVTSFFWKKWKLAFTHLHGGNYGNMNETWLVSLEQRSIMMTWLDSWQYVITWHTWHTWHDVKAWLHKHKVLYLTSSICRCEWTEAMISLLFHTVSMSWNSLQLSSFAWPQRVTLKPKVTSWSTWLLLSLLVFVLHRWFFRCFVKFSGHGIHSNYCQLRGLNAWPGIRRSRHGLRDFGYLCLYSSYSDDFFVVL